MKITVNQRRIRCLAIVAIAWTFWLFIHDQLGIRFETFSLPRLQEHLAHAEIGVIVIAFWGLWEVLVRRDYE